MALLGKRITIFCLNYIYTGDLVGVNDTCVLLENPAIVYETGPFTTKEWKDAQALPNSLYVSMRSEEHTSELQSLMRISYAVFCLKNKIKHPKNKTNTYITPSRTPSTKTHDTYINPLT